MTSVTVVTKGPEANAGSMLSLSRTMGMTMAPKAAAISVSSIATAITAASMGTPNQKPATSAINTPKVRPFMAPTVISRQHTRKALLAVSSRVAIARTATVIVWVPALPPMEATIGISTASATIWLMVSAYMSMTSDATMAVT